MALNEIARERAECNLPPLNMNDPAIEIEPPFALGDARDDAGAAGFDGDDAPLRVTPLLATLRSRGSGEL